MGVELCVQGKRSTTYGGSGLSYSVGACPLVPCNGEAVFRLVISSERRVPRVHTDTSKKKNEQYEQCIIQKLKKLCFPAPEGEKSVVVKSLRPRALVETTMSLSYGNTKKEQLEKSRQRQS